jgi:hypothetical protein
MTRDPARMVEPFRPSGKADERCGRLPTPRTASSGNPRSEWTSALSHDHLRPRDIERMVDEGLDARDEAHGVRERRVELEGGFVFPAGMDVEEPRIADRAEGVDVEAAGLLAGDGDQAGRTSRGQGACRLFSRSLKELHHLLDEERIAWRFMT